MMVADDFQTLCRNFFTDSMTHVCSSRVPESLTKKYRNRLINAKDPYSIFKLDSRNSSYLIAFRFPEIRDCRTLWMMDVHKINCETKDGELRKLFFGYSYRKCYTIAMNMTSELKAHCGARNYAENTQSGYYYTNNENNVIQTNSTACLLLGTSPLVICLIISFLMFAILQWKASRL